MPHKYQWKSMSQEFTKSLQSWFELLFPKNLGHKLFSNKHQFFLGNYILWGILICLGIGKQIFKHHRELDNFKM